MVCWRRVAQNLRGLVPRHAECKMREKWASSDHKCDLCWATIWIHFIFSLTKIAVDLLPQPISVAFLISLKYQRLTNYGFDPENKTHNNCVDYIWVRMSLSSFQERLDIVAACLQPNYCLLRLFLPLHTAEYILRTSSLDREESEKIWSFSDHKCHITFGDPSWALGVWVSTRANPDLTS